MSEQNNAVNSLSHTKWNCNYHIVLLRYIPDDMINAEQRKIKYEGIAETIKYTNDKNDRKYAEYIEKGDLASAKKGSLVITNKNKANNMLAPIGVQPSEREDIINLANSSLSQYKVQFTRDYTG